MVTCALRYCLGRQSYVVGSCIEFIQQVWDQLPKSSQGVITRDILESFDDGSVGSDYDADAWRSLVRWCFNELKQETKDWLFRALAHRENATDALTYNDIGKSVTVQDEDGKPCKGVVVGYADKQGVMYKISSWRPLKQDWFYQEEVKFQ